MAAITPIEENLIYITHEVGPINSQNLLSLVREAPAVSDTMAFSLWFEASQGYMNGSSANLMVDFDNRRLDLEKISIPLPRDESQFAHILKGGKLDRLDLTYPGFYSGESDFALGAEAFEIARQNLNVLQEAGGYNMSTLPFRLSHYMVRVPDTYPGFFFNSYGSKINLETNELIKGKPEMKLVLRFTEDFESSEEVRAYKEILNSFGILNKN